MIFLPKRLLSIGVFAILVTASAQDDFIRGKLRDARTNEPVVFATVQVKGRAKGVISNQDGSFRIPIQFKAWGDSLEVSSMGYERRVIAIESLVRGDINVIRISPGVVALSEAVVSGSKRRRLSARRIVRKAIEALPRNYPRHSFATIGYYRDLQLNDQGRYINMNEAILEVFDAGFGQSDYHGSEVVIYDYKRNNEFPRNPVAESSYNYQTGQKVIDQAYIPGYGGNEFVILRLHDAIRNHDQNTFDFVNRLERDLLAHHSFSKGSNTYLDDEPLYTINIKKSTYDARVLGKLFISQRDFAIHRMQYAVYDNREPGKFQDRSDTPIIFEVHKEYKKREGGMYLNYISFHNAFQLWDAPTFKVDNMTVDLLKRGFRVTFNRTPESRSALMARNYEIRFKGKRLKFSKIALTENSVALYPDVQEVEMERMFAVLEARAKQGPIGREVLKIQVGKVRDLEGNLVNKGVLKEFQQYREFFVQHVETDALVPADSLRMHKGRPIFADQPIVRPDNLDDYWMNTPLPTIAQ